MPDDGTTFQIELKELCSDPLSSPASLRDAFQCRRAIFVAGDSRIQLQTGIGLICTYNAPVEKRHEVTAHLFRLLALSISRVLTGKPALAAERV